MCSPLSPLSLTDLYPIIATALTRQHYCIHLVMSCSYQETFKMHGLISECYSLCYVLFLIPSLAFTSTTVMDLSSERAPHRVNIATFRKKIISGHKLDTKTFWLTDWPSVVTWHWLWLNISLVCTKIFASGQPYHSQLNIQVSEIFPDFLFVADTEQVSENIMFWLA
jgi:hypothetical protein